MSAENLEIVRRAIAAFNARDNSAWNELTAADIEIHPVPEWPENSVVRGRDDVWDFLIGNETAWEGGDYILTEEAVAGETVLACVERAVAGKESGVPVGDLRFYGVFEVRDRELVRGDYFLSRDQALESAGLSE